MQHFATQLNSHQQTSRSFRADRYRKTGKRQRKHGSESASSSPEPDGVAKSESLASQRPLEVQQLRATGLSREAHFVLPPAPFPHADTRQKPQKCATQVAEELAKEPIRLYAAQSSAGGRLDASTSLKSKHLNNLSTIMHHCLLQGDLERAGRAWGMLLRTRVSGGDNIDPRNHNRWGIGAEIVLHRDYEKSTYSSQPDDVESTASHDHKTLTSSLEGFELAREYYERLIIQYPYRKLSPNNVDERTLWPAMFSLWILEISEEAKRKRRRLDRITKSSDSMSDAEGTKSIHESTEITVQMDAIQLEELTRAMEVAERIDQLIVSPPFDKHATLLHLRGHVSLCIGSLMVKRTDVDEDWEMDSVRSIEAEDPDAQSQKYRNLINYQKELQHADSFFQRAESNGGSRQAAMTGALQWKLKEVARQLSHYCSEIGDD